MRPRIPIAAVLAVVAATVLACSGAPSGSVASTPTVSSAWARPGPAGGGSAAYLEITGGAGADALLSASSPGAASVELHETSTQGGMTGMHPIASLAVPAGQTVTLKPGGHHLMIMGLKQALAVGDRLQLDLVFQNAGPVVVEAEVKAG